MQADRQEIEATKADLDKMRSYLAQMKANLLTITTRNELDQWRNNVDMWDVMVGHMDRMLKQMELPNSRRAALILRPAKRNADKRVGRVSYSFFCVSSMIQHLQLLGIN